MLDSGADKYDKFSPKDIDFNDISWVMESIDLEAILDRLGIRIVSRRGDQFWGYCPDHMEFVGKDPSHPKWTVDVKTGKTFCFTESRGSNIVYIASRLKKISALSALEWILGNSINSVEARYSRIKKMINHSDPHKEVSAFQMSRFEKYIKNGELHSGSISLLLKSNILPDTARRFECVEFTEGYYKNRFILPVRDIDKKLVGFIATDTLGCEEWLKNNPKKVDTETKILRETTKDDYRKVLYPFGFKVSHYLIGENEFKKDGTAILTEGCRDMMKLRQEKFDGALSIGGTNLSDDQVIVLTKLHPKRVIVMLDGDEAGRHSEEKVAKKCVDYIPEVFITRIPLGKDPKDCSREEFLYHMKHSTKRVYKGREIY